MLHFLSFLGIMMAQCVDILSHKRQGPTCLTRSTLLLLMPWRLSTMVLTHFARYIPVSVQGGLKRWWF